MLSVLQESFWERLSAVIRLKRPTFEAIQRDPGATSQSWWIVVLLGLANGIAWIITPIVVDFPGMTDEMASDVAALAAAFTFDTTERQIAALVVAIILTILSWYLSSWLLRVIGNRVTGKEGQQVTTAEMRRLVAWGYSPTLASFLTPIPVIGPLLATLGALWTFVTGVMAVRIAFGVGTWKAIGIEIAAFLVLAVVVVVIAVVLSTVVIASSLA
jgi:Yip1 domain